MDDAPPVELQPEQPPAVEHAVAELIAEDVTTVDPWWAAGIHDALHT